MVDEKNYLVELLITSGVRKPVHTSLKKLKDSNAIQVGAVLRNGEKFMRSGNKRTYADENGNKFRRIKIFDRTTQFRVVIADATEDGCEKILNKFLSGIGSGIEVDGNWEDIVVGEADWVEEKDSILSAKIAVQIDITFMGGVYKDKALIKANIGGIEMGKE